MNHARFLIIFLFAAALLVTNAGAQESKIKRADLPAAVQHTVEAQSHGATVRGFSKEIENGQTYYEAEMVVNGHSKDMLLDPSGTVVEVEEQVAMASLPGPVRAGLQSKAGKGRITKVESITKHEKLVAYEAKVLTDGKRSEVQVGPEGKSLDHEE